VLKSPQSTATEKPDEPSRPHLPDTILVFMPGTLELQCANTAKMKLNKEQTKCSNCCYLSMLTDLLQRNM
jgi:hypothetical protein